jgi:hypothetical protein
MNSSLNRATTLALQLKEKNKHINMGKNQKMRTAEEIFGTKIIIDPNMDSTPRKTVSNKLKWVNELLRKTNNLADLKKYLADKEKQTA